MLKIEAKFVILESIRSHVFGASGLLHELFLHNIHYNKHFEFGHDHIIVFCDGSPSSNDVDACLP